MNPLKKTLSTLTKCVFLFFITHPLTSVSDTLQSPARLTVKAHQFLLVNATVAGKRIFSVGERGHIVYSDDEGESWTQANSPTQMLLTAIDFIDDKNGWAVGHDSIVLGTHDGGENWGILFEAADAEKPLLDVVFFDAKNGLVTGAYGLIMRTSDGGKTWHEFMIEEIDWHFNSILRVGKHVLIAGEAGTLIRSSNQGETWTPLPSPYVGSFFGAMAKSSGGEHKIIAYGLRGNAFHSSDLGDTWTEIDTGVTTNILGGTFTPSGDAVLLGAGGTILRKAANKTVFKRVPYRGFENLTSVVAINDSKLIVFGARGASKLTIHGVQGQR